MGPIRSAALGRPLDSLGRAREAGVAVVEAAFAPVGRLAELRVAVPEVPGRSSLALVLEARLAVPEADVLELGTRDNGAEARAADLVLGRSSRSLARVSEARLAVPEADILTLGARVTGEGGATSVEERAKAVALRDALIEVLGRSLASLGQSFEGDVAPLVEARVSVVEGVGRAVASLARIVEARAAAVGVPVPASGDEGGLTITTVPLSLAGRDVPDPSISPSRIGVTSSLSDGSSSSAIGTCNAEQARKIGKKSATSAPYAIHQQG